MVALLALALLQSASPAGDSAFVEGRVQCRLVDRVGVGHDMAFELAQSRVVVREGAGFVPNGTEFDVVKQDSSRMNLRIRAWHFPVEADAAPVRFQITDMVDPDYRSINATVLRSVSVSFGHGQAPMMQSRLEAVGMCSQVSSRGES